MQMKASCDNDKVIQDFSTMHYAVWRHSYDHLHINQILKCLSGLWGFYIFVIFEYFEKNCSISCSPKMLSSWTFLLLKLTKVTSTQESVI